MGLRILALGPAIHDTSPGQRFRIEQWARHLRADGLTFVEQPFEDRELHDILYQAGRKARKTALMLRAFLRRYRLLGRVREFDLVYLFREGTLAGPPVFEQLLARRGVPVVFDFDDAVWIPYVSPANKHLSYLKCFWKTGTLCRLSRHVMAGNPYLADYARQFNPNVSIVPTTIDTDVYQVRPPDPGPPGRPVTIGWTGSYSTVQHLDTIRDALQRLRQRVQYRLVVLGTREYRLDGVDVTARPWQAATEVADLQQFDVGLMPLPDDNWSKGKCGLKLLQCMGVGVPVVGSPVGVNRDIIREGHNGFLAASPDEWVAKLARLVEDAALRRDLGLDGRRTVEEHYSARIWAPRVREIFEKVAHGRVLASAPPTGVLRPAHA